MKTSAADLLNTITQFMDPDVTLVRLKGAGLRVTIRRIDPAPVEFTPPHSWPPALAPRPEVIGDVAEAIRAVLREAERPIKATTIASRCGREANSHFRSVLRRLVRAGEVRHIIGNRYWLAVRPPPKLDANGFAVFERVNGQAVN